MHDHAPLLACESDHVRKLVCDADSSNPSSLCFVTNASLAGE